MPYISKEQIKSKRQALKKALPDYKLSVTNSHYSGIRVQIMEGPIDLGSTYQQLNTYYPDQYSQDIQDLLNIMLPIMREGMGEGHYDGDYGHVPSWYNWVEIGRWDKHYKIAQ